MAEHSDSFSKMAQPEARAAAPAAQSATKKTNNEAQSALAAAERQHEFTVGGGDPEGGAPAQQPLARIEGAILRVRASDRPSPFGVAHFPPLPVPPGLDSDR
ncbi:MAG: hypothetical protein HOV81_35605 [Kofleriaceae bacterium]|nr:hypothetical protein [Kofleriaceae bacterium]